MNAQVERRRDLFIASRKMFGKKCTDKNEDALNNAMLHHPHLVPQRRFVSSPIIIKSLDELLSPIDICNSLRGEYNSITIEFIIIIMKILEDRLLKTINY